MHANDMTNIEEKNTFNVPEGTGRGPLKLPSLENNPTIAFQCIPSYCIKMCQSMPVGIWSWGCGVHIYFSRMEVCSLQCPRHPNHRYLQFLDIFNLLICSKKIKPRKNVIFLETVVIWTTPCPRDRDLANVPNCCDFEPCVSETNS